MLHKYFVTQGTKILSLFGWFWSLESMRSHGRGGVRRGEVSETGQRKGFLNGCWPIWGGGSRGPQFEITKKTLYLGWVVLPVQPGSVWGGGGRQPPGGAGCRAWSSLKQGGCRGGGCGERDREWWTISGQDLLLWWHNVRTNCTLTYIQV